MSRAIHAGLCLSLLVAVEASAGDWPFWRGPEQVGRSREQAVVTSWSPDGENLLWKVPVGGRTTPILMDGRLYMITPTGEGLHLQERVICLDAETGKTIWEHKFNVFHTDIVEARLGWTSVVGDPETGNIYAHGTGGEFFCFNRDGKVLWKHSLGEEFGRFSGYGGRLHTPIIDEERVIISFDYILSSWGTGKRKAGHRYYAFDKRTGRVLWWAQPGGKPLDTTYSAPVVTVIGGRRVLIAGNADGNIYGMMARTGQKLWTFRLSKRGINPSIVVDGKYAYACHSEENIQGRLMGRIVCIDASLQGDITETGEVWRADEVKVGYSSPAVANGRLYAVTNSAMLHCFDAKTGKRYWEFDLGRVIKGSPTVTADGVIYVGTVNGRFHILKDAGDHCESLSLTQFTRPDDLVVEINGSPVVVDGRVYFMTAYDTYCLAVAGESEVGARRDSRTSEGEDSRAAAAGAGKVPPMMPELPPDPTKPALLQIVPGDVTLFPGEQLALETRLFDINGRLIGKPTAVWSATGVKGRFDSSASFTADTANTCSAGLIHATFNEFKASARVRISPRLPITEDFESMPVGKIPPGWIGLDVKAKLVERDGGVVLQKLAKSPSAAYMRMRSFSGPPILGGYTVVADLLGSPKQGRRATRPDMGLINSRYKLILLGKERRLRIVSYSPIPRLQEEVPFDWKTDVWYRAMLRVEPDGDQARIYGKVWPRDAQEPEAWTIEVVDPCPNREGSPGLYGYSKGTSASKPGATMFYDNYQVMFND